MIEQHQSVVGLREDGPPERAGATGAKAFVALLFLTACVLATTAPAQSIYNDGGGTGGAAVFDGRSRAGSVFDGGGTPRRPEMRHYRRADDGFLRNGGGISQDPDIEIDSPRRRFLQDGGGITPRPGILIERGGARSGFFNEGFRCEPDVLLGGDRRPCLSSGRSVRGTPPVKFAVSPGLRSDHAHRSPPGRAARGWRVLDAPEAVFTSNGSFTIVSGAGQRNEVILSDVGDGGVDIGFDSAAYLPQGAVVSRTRGFSGPKIIDVARDSLASRPVRPGSIEIISGGTGGPKIIRIASDFGRSAGAANARQSASDEHARPGEPWTREWLSRCSRTYASFDPQFGTYRDRSGAVKFCTGE